MFRDMRITFLCGAVGLCWTAGPAHAAPARAMSMATTPACRLMSGRGNPPRYRGRVAGQVHRVTQESGTENHAVDPGECRVEGAREIDGLDITRERYVQADRGMCVCTGHIHRGEWRRKIARVVESPRAAHNTHAGL